MNICTILEDGDRKLICSKHNEINLGDRVRLASSGHSGVVTTRSKDAIWVTPWEEWSSLTENGLVGKILKGETLLFAPDFVPDPTLVKQ